MAHFLSYDSYMTLKCLPSISSILNHSQKALYCTWFMASNAKKKKIFDWKFKTFRGWVPMNFHGTKKLLPMVSQDLWARNRKIVFHGNWNPRASIYRTWAITYAASVYPGLKYFWYLTVPSSNDGFGELRFVPRTVIETELEQKLLSNWE